MLDEHLSRRIARRQAYMVGLAPSPSPSPEASPDDDDEDDASSFDDDDLSVTCSLSFVTKRESSFGFKSSLVFRRRVSVTPHNFDTYLIIICKL